MNLSRPKGLYLFSLLTLSGFASSSNAAEQAVVETPPAALTAPAVVVPEKPVKADETAPAPAQAVKPDAVPVETSDATPPAAAEPAPAPPVKASPSEEVTAESIKAAGIEPAPANMLESEEQKRAYASGVMLAHFIEEQLAVQKNLHITLNKNILLAGIADTFSHQGKMSDEDIRLTMSTFDEQVKVLTQAQNAKKQAADNAYIEDFAKREGVKKTKQGLLYLIDNKGEGPALKNTDTVQINYKGTLVDGTVIDGPQVDNAYQIFRISEMPPVLRDSVKLIRKGGQVTVVIPPSTLENTKDGKATSPLNTVVIYTIAVADVNKP